MGRPRVKTIDDSAPVEEKKEIKKPVKKQADSLVAKLQAEMGIEEPEAKEEPAEEAQVSEEAKAEETKEKAEPKKKAKVVAKGPAKVRSKKYQTSSDSLNEGIEAKEDGVTPSYKDSSYRINEAVELVKKGSYSKFPGSLEVHINTRVPSVRGMVSLPFASAKKRTIIAFGDGADKSGADKVGTDSDLEAIEKGKIDFDILVATPSWMPKLAKLAKVLGPRGLMPNPKNNTVSDDLKKAVEGFQGGQIEYRTEPKAPVIHLGLGKLSQPTEELESNVKILLSTIGKSRIKKVTLAPTMGPSVRIDLNSL